MASRHVLNPRALEFTPSSGAQPATPGTSTINYSWGNPQSQPSPWPQTPTPTNAAQLSGPASTAQAQGEMTAPYMKGASCPISNTANGGLCTGRTSASAPTLPSQGHSYTPFPATSPYTPPTLQPVWPPSGVQKPQMATPFYSPFYLKQASDAAYMEIKRVLAARFADAAGAHPLVGIAAVLAEEVQEKLHWLNPVDAHLPKNQYLLQWSVRLAQESEEALRGEIVGPPLCPGAQ